MESVTRQAQITLPYALGLSAACVWLGAVCLHCVRCLADWREQWHCRAGMHAEEAARQGNKQTRNPFQKSLVLGKWALVRSH